jgi:hypothetical protein
VRWAVAALMLMAVAMPVSAAALDVRAGAQALEDPQPDFTEAIDRPGDLDWYHLPGLDIGDRAIQAVQVAVAQPGTDCTAAPPLLVALLNPEASRCAGSPTTRACALPGSCARSSGG